MNTLYIIQGFLGAGKTTHAKALVRKTGAVRLTADEWCAENFPPEKLSTAWNACFSEAIKALWREAELLLEKDKSVILDFGFWNRTSRDEARKKAKKLNVRCEHHYIYAPDHILLGRLKRRSGEIAMKNIQNFTACKKLFEEPAEDERALWIESSSPRLEGGMYDGKLF